MGTELSDHRDGLAYKVKALQSKKGQVGDQLHQSSLQRHSRTGGAQLLEEWKIVQVKRECYVIAHELAHLARRNSRTAAEQLQSDFVKYLPACM